MAPRIDCDENPTQDIDIWEWLPASETRWDHRRFNRHLEEMWERPVKETQVVMLQPPAPLRDRFIQLASDWSKDTAHISSVSDLTTHPSYQKIIQLGWDVVPLLLADIQTNRRFWFPALNAITNVRPFDPGDAGNNRRMTEAWIKWGQRKGLI